MFNTVKWSVRTQLKSLNSPWGLKRPCISKVVWTNQLSGPSSQPCALLSKEAKCFCGNCSSIRPQTQPASTGDIHIYSAILNSTVQYNCIIIVESFCATTKGHMCYFNLITLYCKTAPSITYQHDVWAYWWLCSMAQWLCESCWALRKWGEQVCFSVHFGVIIEMDGSDCCPARSAEPTVDHRPAESYILTVHLSHSVCLPLSVDAFTYTAECYFVFILMNKDMFLFFLIPAH